MSPLFGKSERKISQEAAAQAEFERRNALPVADLAAEILPAFGRDGKRPAHSALGASNWLMASYPGGTKYLKDLQRPVREAIQALEHGGLLNERVRSSGGGAGAQMIVDITRLGETAFADGDVRRHLQPPPQP
jgi:hypothetical protein